MEKQDAAVMVLDSGSRAEDAVRALGRGGFDSRSISVVGQGLTTPPPAIALDETGHAVEGRGRASGPGGSIPGLIPAPAMFRLPGAGAIAAGGHLAVALGRASGDAMQNDAMSVIGDALREIGVPKGRVVKYELALKAGKCLLMIHGDDDEVARALSILAEAWAWEVA